MRKSLMLLTLLFFSQISVCEDTLQQNLQRRLQHYEFSEQTFLQALMKFAAETRVPMGIEVVETPDALQPIHRTFTDSSVSEILEALVSSQPGYTMEINDGIVHILRPKDHDEELSFLNLYIDRFEVRNEHVGFASYRLQQKIQSIINPPLPSILGKPEGVAGSITSGMGDKAVSFTVSQVRVRDILDKFAILSELKLWVVIYPNKSELAFGRIRKTKSIFTVAEVPDRDQPVWGRFVWGFDPVSKTLRQDWYERKLTP